MAASFTISSLPIRPFRTPGARQVRAVREDRPHRLIAFLASGLLPGEETIRTVMDRSPPAPLSRGHGGFGEELDGRNQTMAGIGLSGRFDLANMVMSKDGETG